jgi:signal peptidase I
LELFNANKKAIYLFSAVVLAAAFFAFSFFWEKIPENPISEDCSSRIEEKTVNGNSLSGLVEDGETVYLHYGYFECKKMEKEDIVAYSYAGRSNPIIKVIKGVPGDKFELRAEKERWEILINGEPAKNSKGEEYSLGEKAYNMLSLYEKDYGGEIPPNAYLIFGNLAYGTLDSTYFGLVSRSDILGAILSY